MERTYTTPRLDKLGVRPGGRVALLGPIAEADDTFEAELRERTDDVTVGEPSQATDVVVLVADATSELAPERLRALASRLKPNGAIWVVFRKGKAATMRDTEVIACTLAADLVDNKVASFSATHTALRMVIPLARRPKPTSVG